MRCVPEDDGFPSASRPGGKKLHRFQGLANGLPLRIGDGHQRRAHRGALDNALHGQDLFQPGPVVPHGRPEGGIHKRLDQNQMISKTVGSF